MSYHFGIDPRRIPDIPKRMNASVISRHQHPTTLTFANAFQYNKTQKRQYLASSLAPVSNHVNIGMAFDQLIGYTEVMPVNEAIEQTAGDLFNALNSILWVDNKAHGWLYSSTKGITCPYHSGIVGYVFQSQTPYISLSPPKDPNYSLCVDSNSRPSLYIPLNVHGKENIGVLQLTRDIDPFNENDLQLAEQFSKKFSIYAHILFSLSQPTSLDEGRKCYPSVLIHKIQDQLKCRSVEIWKQCDGKYWTFDSASSTFSESKPGVVLEAFQIKSPLTLSDVTQSSFYDSAIDGNIKESIVAIPIDYGNTSFVVLVRGSRFGLQDQIALTAIVPLLIKSIFAYSPTEPTSQKIVIPSPDNEGFAARLRALLEVAESLSGVLDIDALIPTIMQKACKLLNTERCSLFLVDSDSNELVTRFHGGLEQSIRLPKNRGIAGHTATTGEIVNIMDAYSDPRFDKNVDKMTGYKTKNLLTVPIINNRGEIAGVAEMINKIDNSPFNEEDVKMMMAFNVFCGISLDNAKLYQASLDLTRQLRGFVEMSSALNTTQTVRDIIEQILFNAQKAINAKRATIFLFDELNGLQLYISRGSESAYGTKLAQIAMDNRNDRIFDSADLSEIIPDSGRSGTKLGKTGSTSRVSSVLASDVNPLDDKESACSVCDLLLLSSSGQVLGVMEFEMNFRALSEDIKLLDCFAVFASVSLERSELKEIAKVGHVETEMKKWISIEERSQCEVPEKLVIPEEDGQTIFQINFDAVAWDGIGHFKVLFKIFSFFDILKEFKVTNEKFFKFLSEISSTYNKVPYHNWRHAVDVTQFVTYQIVTAGLDKVLTKFELFGLLVSSICHDANHDGFSNVFNVKAETPLGILFKNQSVMETHHCSIAIGVISKEEFNIFSILDAAQYKKMWNLIIQLILITDMAKHFNFLKDLNGWLDNGPLDMENQEHRLGLMQVLLKCGDVSNVSRPFELADKWCDVLCEEFFRQGDLEKASGMEYTSDLNDREHLDKPKSQIGFYTFVCLPLYETAARSAPPLQINVEQVKSNLAVWKKTTAEKAEAEKAAAQKA